VHEILTESPRARAIKNRMQSLALDRSPPRPKLDATHYRMRAEACRKLAEEESDAAMRKQLLGISDTYARIANQIETFDRDHS
jgi:hypothetical protein